MPRLCLLKKDRKIGTKVYVSIYTMACVLKKFFFCFVFCFCVTCWVCALVLVGYRQFCLLLAHLCWACSKLSQELVIQNNTVWTRGVLDIYGLLNWKNLNNEKLSSWRVYWFAVPVKTKTNAGETGKKKNQRELPLLVITFVWIQFQNRWRRKDSRQLSVKPTWKCLMFSFW